MHATACTETKVRMKSCMLSKATMKRCAEVFHLSPVSYLYICACGSMSAYSPCHALLLQAVREEEEDGG